MYKPSIQSLIARDGSKCHYCNHTVKIAKDSSDNGKRVATREHIVPRSFGGTWAKHNIILACMDCNSKRANEYFYCGCDFCLKAYELNINDRFMSMMNYNATRISKTRKGQWKLFWRGSLYFYNTWQDAMDALLIKEKDYWK